MSAGEWACVCGRDDFATQYALAGHARSCPEGKARSRSLVRAQETGNWHGYAERFAGGCLCVCHGQRGAVTRPHTCDRVAALGGNPERVEP